MNTHELIHKDLLFSANLWSDETKEEITNNKERFVWFTHHVSATDSDIFNSAYGHVIYNKKYADYIVDREEHLLPTDKLINSNIGNIKGAKEIKSYGIINIIPERSNNKIAYFIDMNPDPLTAAFVIYHNGNSYHYYPKIRYKQGSEEINLFLVPGKFDIENSVPYVYKQGYADIAVSKEGYNTGMTLQGYILGYKIKDFDFNLDIDIRCHIPNSDNDIYPAFEISVLPHSKNITDIEIYMGTDHPHTRYKPITVPRLVTGVKQGFDMIAEKFDRFGTDKEQDVKISSYLVRSHDRRAIVFTKNKIDYTIWPHIKINGILRSLIPYAVNEPSDILYENLIFSSENKFIGKYYSIASSQKILNNDCSIRDSIIVYLAIDIVNDELKFKIQIQNPWFMDNEVYITISPKTWVEEKDRHISEFLNSDDIHLTLEPGKKATIESK